jgi:hypothetical protein
MTEVVVHRDESAEATGFEPAISALTGLHVRPLHHASSTSEHTNRPSLLSTKVRASKDMGTDNANFLPFLIPRKFRKFDPVRGRFGGKSDAWRLALATSPPRAPLNPFRNVLAPCCAVNPRVNPASLTSAGA